VKIVASNQLNEQVIQSLLYEQDAPIDAFGVGTELVSGKPDAALDGVYKLAEIEGSPRMKISENVQKVTLPGNKKLIRFLDADGMFFRDGIFLENESLSGEVIIHHPIHPEKSTTVTGLSYESLLQPVVQHGKSLIPGKSPAQIHEYLKERIAQLPVEHQRFVRPHIYKTGISAKLLQVRNTLMQKSGKTF
jgi:nicotinate phosphoribosyltransferase